MTLDRIEQSCSRRGEYVGYAGGAWRVRKHGAGGWEAFGPSRGADRLNRYMRAPTLAAMDSKLNAVAADADADQMAARDAYRAMMIEQVCA